MAIVGLQAAKGLHHCSESPPFNSQKLLEGHYRQEMWSSGDALSTGGEWRGNAYSYIPSA